MDNSNKEEQNKAVNEVYRLIMEAGKKDEAQELFDGFISMLNEGEPQNGVILAAMVAVIAEMMKKLPQEQAEVEIIGFAKACRTGTINLRKHLGLDVPQGLDGALKQIAALLAKGQRSGVVEVELGEKDRASAVNEFSEQTRRDVEAHLGKDEETLDRVNRVNAILNEPGKGGTRFANDRRTSAIAGALVSVLERADWVTREAVLGGVSEAVINILKAREDGHKEKTAESETEQARRTH